LALTAGGAPALQRCGCFTLNVTGTLGVLVKAKSTGLIPSFHEAAHAMRQQGIHYNASLITRLAQHLGEIAK